MIRNTPKILFITFAFMFCAFPGFAGGGAEGDTGFQVAATTSIIADVLENICGNEIPITTLLQPGVDPHSYQPAPRDMVLIEKSRLLFVGGYDLEEEFLHSLEKVSAGKLVEVSRKVQPIIHEGQVHAIDPHTWMSPRNVLLWVDVIEEELVSADPSHASIYKYNAEIYRETLIALDAFMVEQFSVIPEEKRILFTDHSSVEYFARDYGFKIGGAILPGVSSSAEPSAGDIVRVAEHIRESGVPVIFIDASAGDRTRNLAETVVSETGADIQVKTLLTASLTKKGESGDSYISFMRYNTRQIIAGFGY